MAGPGSWRYNAAVRRARLISLLLLVAVPTQARGREKILLLDRSPLKMDRRIRQQVMDGLQTALESGGFLVQRRSPTTPDRAPIEELLTEAKSHSEQFHEQQALETLNRAERAFRAGFGRWVSVKPLIRVLLARARLGADLGNKAEVKRDLGRAVVLDPELTLDPGLFPPDLVRTFRRIKQRTRHVSLTITTSPPGHPVWVDGKRRGQAPVLVKLPPGEHFVAAGWRGTTRGKVVPVGEQGVRVTLAAPQRARLSDHRLRNMGQEVGARWVVGLYLRKMGAGHQVRVRAIVTRAVQVPRVYRAKPVERPRLTWAISQVAVQLQGGLRGGTVGGGPTPIRAPSTTKEGSIFTSWWFWTAVVAVVGGGTAAAVVLTRDSDPGVKVTIER